VRDEFGDRTVKKEACQLTPEFAALVNMGYATVTEL